MEIKEYKPLALVFYIDWDGNRSALPLDETKIQDFKKALETSKMVELEWVIINTFDIKEIRPSTHTSELEKYFYSKSIEDRAKIKNRALKRTWDKKQNIIEIISQIPVRKYNRYRKINRKAKRNNQNKISRNKK